MLSRTRYEIRQVKGPFVCAPSSVTLDRHLVPDISSNTPGYFGLVPRNTIPLMLVWLVHTPLARNATPICPDQHDSFCRLMISSPDPNYSITSSALRYSSYSLALQVDVGERRRVVPCWRLHSHTNVGRCYSFIILQCNPYAEWASVALSTSAPVGEIRCGSTSIKNYSSNAR